MDRIKCNGCDSMFFFDEDSIIENKYFCSHCLPKLRKCLLCEKLVIMEKDTKYLEGLCSECKGMGTGLTNVWLIKRFKTFQKDNFTCRYCGRSPLKDLFVKLNCDHIMPRSKGGKDDLDNLITSCEECNRGKMDILLTDGQNLLLEHRIKKT